MVMRWRIRLNNAGLLAKPSIISLFWSSANDNVWRRPEKRGLDGACEPLKQCFDARGGRLNQPKPPKQVSRVLDGGKPMTTLQVLAAAMALAAANPLAQAHWKL